MPPNYRCNCLRKLLFQQIVNFISCLSYLLTGTVLILSSAFAQIVFIIKFSTSLAPFKNTFLCVLPRITVSVAFVLIVFGRHLGTLAHATTAPPFKHWSRRRVKVRCAYTWSVGWLVFLCHLSHGRKIYVGQLTINNREKKQPTP